MAALKNQVALGTKAVFDTSLIYSTRAVYAKDMFQNELAPLPTYLFQDDGSMRATTKSRLKSLLAVEHSERIDKQPDAVVVDGCAVQWLIAWTTNGTVLDFVNKFTNYVLQKVKQTDVYLVLDRYHSYSIKRMTR